MFRILGNACVLCFIFFLSTGVPPKNSAQSRKSVHLHRQAVASSQLQRVDLLDLAPI